MNGTSTQPCSLSGNKHPSVFRAVKQWHFQPVIGPLLGGSEETAESTEDKTERPIRVNKWRKNQIGNWGIITHQRFLPPLSPSFIPFAPLACSPLLFQQHPPTPLFPPSISLSPPLSLWRCFVFRVASNLQIGWSNNGCKSVCVYASKFGCTEQCECALIPPAHVCKMHTHG